ncbi:hypothetical protein SNEBB_008230 [Seison nebaliae]|nr:hypothetical protein SNEBB_008230 [Seison nebaliae]
MNCLLKTFNNHIPETALSSDQNCAFKLEITDPKHFGPFTYSNRDNLIVYDKNYVKLHCGFRLTDVTRRTSIEWIVIQGHSSQIVERVEFTKFLTFRHRRNELKKTIKDTDHNYILDSQKCDRASCPLIVYRANLQSNSFLQCRVRQDTLFVTVHNYYLTNAQICEGTSHCNLTTPIKLGNLRCPTCHPAILRGIRNIQFGKVSSFIDGSFKEKLVPIVVKYVDSIFLQPTFLRDRNWSIAMLTVTAIIQLLLMAIISPLIIYRYCRAKNKIVSKRIRMKERNIRTAARRRSTNSDIRLPELAQKKEKKKGPRYTIDGNMPKNLINVDVLNDLDKNKLRPKKQILANDYRDSYGGKLRGNSKMHRSLAENMKRTEQYLHEMKDDLN